ncbi:MAG: hypothetical protein ACI9U2_000465 [Bradymonadia bacterium]|jgi:hypothetical protein
MSRFRMPSAYHASDTTAAGGLGAAGWAGRALRALIGLLLATTALGKSLDLAGFAEVIGTYQVFPPSLWLIIAISMTGVEWALAGWLLSGRRPVLACGAAAVMHLVFTGWAAIAMLRGIPVPNCGCFGVFLARPLGWSTVVEDAVVTGVCLLTLWMCAKARGRTSA